MLAQMGNVAAWQLRSIQSSECAVNRWKERPVSPSILYKYIPISRIGQGAPRSLRATQPSALNDVMECSIAPMGGGGAGGSRFRAAMGAKLQECLESPCQAVNSPVVGDQQRGHGVVRFLSGVLGLPGGVASFSRDALVPTMWAHSSEHRRGGRVRHRGFD